MEKKQSELRAKLSDAKMVAVKQQASTSGGPARGEPPAGTSSRPWARMSPHRLTRRAPFILVIPRKTRRT